SVTSRAFAVHRSRPIDPPCYMQGLTPAPGQGKALVRLCPPCAPAVRLETSPRLERIVPRLDLYRLFKALPVGQAQAHDVKVLASVQCIHEILRGVGIAADLLPLDRHRRGRILQGVPQQFEPPGMPALIARYVHDRPLETQSEPHPR